jgi:hypothetical protein
MTDETWSRNGSGTPDDGPTARPAEPVPAYIAKAFALLAAHGLAADDVTGIQVRHESRCPLLAGAGVCNCDPDVSLEQDGQDT